MTTRPNTYIVGIDVGGTTDNVTVVDGHGHALIPTLLEVPSLVQHGPAKAIGAMVDAFNLGLEHAGVPRADVVGVGLDTPGPAGPTGVLSSRGSTNFSGPEWWGFDIRAALEDTLGIPVVYSNDANAASLYAHRMHFGPVAGSRSSVAAIVGTGLGGGVVVNGHIVVGATGMAGELGHVRLQLEGLLEPDQPVPVCNCGNIGDVESIASLTAIGKNLLPYWLTRYPEHELASVDISTAAKRVRGFAEAGDPMALAIFEQQAAALGRLFSISANFTDPDAFFIGGGVVETVETFRTWFVERVRHHTELRTEQAVVEMALVPDRDMAGARGAALAALEQLG